MCSRGAIVFTVLHSKIGESYYRATFTNDRNKCDNTPVRSSFADRSPSGSPYRARVFATLREEKWSTTRRGLRFGEDERLADSSESALPLFTVKRRRFSRPIRRRLLSFSPLLVLQPPPTLSSGCRLIGPIGQRSFGLSRDSLQRRARSRQVAGEGGHERSRLPRQVTQRSRSSIVSSITNDPFEG